MVYSIDGEWMSDESDNTDIWDDSWVFEDEDGYARTKHYVAATNRFNHSMETRVRVPPDFGAQVKRLVDRGMIEAYKSPADFYRDAAYHHLHYLNEQFQDANLENMLTLWGRLNRQEFVAQYMANMESLVSNYRDQLQKASSTTNWYVLRVTLAHAAEDMKELREPYHSEVKALVDSYRMVADRAPR